jgi:hypothetical protein
MTMLILMLMSIPMVMKTVTKATAVALHIVPNVE